TGTNVVEVPIIKTIDDAIKALEQVFKKQKEIIQKQEHLEKQFAENKINKEKYEQEQEKIKELIAQNDKRLDVVNQYVKEKPFVTEAENKNVTNQINSFKSSSSKQSFDESKADELLATFKDFKKKEEQAIAEIKEYLEDFAQGKKVCGEWIEKEDYIIYTNLKYIRYKECFNPTNRISGTIFHLKKDKEDQPDVYIFRTGFDLDNLNTQDHNRKGYYYLIDIESRSRINFIPEEATPNSPIMPQMMKDIIFGIADFVIPIEGGYIVYTGKDFSGEESNRLVAAGLTIWDLSAGKVTKTIKIIGKVSSPAIEGILKTFGKKAVREAGEAIGKVFLKKLDETITKLKNKAKFELEGTGKYDDVKGHHPLAKKAFEEIKEYDYKKAFSVSPKTLQDIWEKVNPTEDIINVHNKITGQQISLYTAWRKANPNKTLEIDDMAEIEIKAMVNAGISEDIATGWVIKALEDLKEKGVTAIKNIPWNGVNN
ncbi:hypothetical protein, partial [Capnocytophaga catalasegens]|uniref:hypothetical protein n=1 Tax=Capnocytophaga catalasegens TaxID=1004260 RepID=UPI002230F632